MQFADVSDLEARWRPLTEDEKERANVLLGDASAYLDRLAQIECVDCELLRIIVCNMVMRSMSIAGSDVIGVSQTSITAGPYTQSYSYSTPAGDFYLTKWERRLLGIETGYIGSIRPMIGANHANWH